MPLATQVATNDARHYPVYQVCEELGIPVAINAGIPGPRVRSKVQHPELLEDVLIDFPDLVVIVAHMGHPYEELLMNYMRKWPNLYLSCTAYAPRYMDPNLVTFMNTKTYRGRVLWGSDEPWFPMRRSLAEARELPLDDDAMAQFLGGTARRLLDRTDALMPAVFVHGVPETPRCGTRCAPSCTATTWSRCSSPASAARARPGSRRPRRRTSPG